MKRLIALACLGTLNALPAVTPAAFAGEDFEDKMAASPDGVVEIANVAGDIRVRGTDGDEVELSARLGDDVEELIFEREGDVIVIRVEVRNSNGWGWGGGGNDGSARLDIRVPRTNDVRVEAVSSDVSVSGVDGRLDVESVSGDIEIESGATRLDLTTMSGDVNIDGSGQTATASLTSVSGDVVARDLGGDIHSTSVSGEVELDLGTVTRLRAQSTSGDVTARAALSADARVEIETVSGEADLGLAGAKDGDYALSTFSGDLDNCFGPDAERRRYSPGRSLKFRHGDGERDVRMSTMSGSIRLCD